MKNAEHRTAGMPGDAVLAKPEPRLAMLILAFATVYLVWGSTYLAIRFAIETMPPFLMAGVRFVIAGAIYLPIAYKRSPCPLTFSHWRAAAIVGLLMLVGGNGLVSWSEQMVPSGATALIIGTVPIWMVLLDWLWQRGARPTIPIVVGLMFGMAGVFMLIGPAGFSDEPIHPLGGGVLLAACVFWSFGSLYSRHAALPSSTFVATAMEMLCAGVMMLVIGSTLGEWSRVEWSAISLKSVLALAYLIVFGSIIALSAYTWLLKATTAARVSTYAYVNPAVAVFLGWLLGGETISGRVIAAAALIIAAVVLINLSRKKAKAPESVVAQPADNSNRDRVVPTGQATKPDEKAIAMDTKGVALVGVGGKDGGPA